ncbi:MAG: PEGA domain-containing protein [Sandaracinaceae bacterium]|nr:PEGA domain-containing protein [Sandaracinaceae bacterium]
MGEIVLVGVPEGAAVLLDEQPVDASSLPVLRTTVGNHTVRVRKPGHTEHSEVVSVQANQRVEVVVDLIPLSHVFVITTIPPGARIFVDGRYFGESPGEVELAPGNHLLRLSLKGHKEIERTLEAIAGEQSKIEVELPPLEKSNAAQDNEVWIWLGIGGALLVAGGGAAAIAAIASQPGSPSEIERFCMGNCVRFDPVF